MLKTMQVLGHNDLDAVAQDLENAVDQKSETTKI